MKSQERRQVAAQEAAEWLLSLNASELTRSERLELIAWLRESPLHVAEMLRVAGAHKRLAEFNDWARISPADPSDFNVEVLTLPETGPRTAAPLTKITATAAGWGAAVAKPRFRLGAIAASVLALAAVIHWAAKNLDGADDTSSPRLMTLQDGTQVRLAPRSRLEVHFKAHERDVVLAQGDALFTVAKDPARPFIVQTGRTRVRAVGTVFGIEREGTSVIVTVQEGRIAVTNSWPAPFSPDETGAGTIPTPEISEISLGAGQQVTVPSAGAAGAVRKVDSRRELAWADGRLIFDNESVAQVVRRFNHFNRVQLRVDDAELAGRPVTAVFNANDPQAFLVFLESVANVRITHPSNNEILISPEGPR